MSIVFLISLIWHFVFFFELFRCFDYLYKRFRFYLLYRDGLKLNEKYIKELMTSGVDVQGHDGHCGMADEFDRAGETCNTQPGVGPD